MHGANVRPDLEGHLLERERRCRRLRRFRHDRRHQRGTGYAPRHTNPGALPATNPVAVSAREGIKIPRSDTQYISNITIMGGGYSGTTTFSGNVGGTFWTGEAQGTWAPDANPKTIGCFRPAAGKMSLTSRGEGSITPTSQTIDLAHVSKNSSLCVHGGRYNGMGVNTGLTFTTPIGKDKTQMILFTTCALESVKADGSLQGSCTYGGFLTTAWNFKPQ